MGVRHVLRNRQMVARLNLHGRHRWTGPNYSVSWFYRSYFVLLFLVLAELSYAAKLCGFKFTDLARRIRWVDNGDTFATHCVGGLVGTIATGLFARKEVAAYDGATVIDGGVFFDGNIKQLGIQMLEALIGFTWSFVGSYVLFALIDCVPGLEVLAENE